MAIYSHSQLSMFDQCPRKYKFKYVERIAIPEQEGVEAFLGSLVHRTLQKLYEDLKYEKLNSLEGLLAYYEDQWRQNWGPRIKMVREGLGEDDYRAYGERCIRNYYRRHHPFTQSQTLSTELHLMFPLDSEGRYQIQGYVDRLARRADGTYEIHDYKTGSSLPVQSQIDSDRQLPLYQIGLQSRWGDVKRVELIWHYVGLDFTLVSHRSPDQLQELSDKIVQLIEQIESCTEFVPIKSRLCDWCEYRAECPLFKHRSAVELMAPEAMAADAGVRLANEYAELKARMDVLDGQLIGLREKILDFARQHGIAALEGNGVRVSVSTREEIALPVRDDPLRRELEAFVKSIGQWEQVSELSLARLTAILEEGEWPREWIQALRQLLRARQAVALRVSRVKGLEPSRDD